MPFKNPQQEHYGNAKAVGEALHEWAFRVNTDVDCWVCGQNPTVGDTELCGPCCFGEADTAGGNW